MIIELKQVTKKYGENSPVLNDISIDIGSGSSVAITGPSGSGKSTLLNLLGTLDFPTSGEVRINGIPTNQYSEDELSVLRNKHIGFVFQTHLLLPQLTVMENILLPLLPGDKEQHKSAPVKARHLLDAVGLSDKLNRFPGEMSVGECQRTAVVRALINGPELLLADEPTGSLDHNSAEILSEMLLKLKKEHEFTLVVVTHSHLLSKRMAINYRLLNGKIIPE